MIDQPDEADKDKHALDGLAAVRQEAIDGLEAAAKGVTNGRRYEPSEAARKLVAELVFAGITQERIGRILNMSDETLRKYFSYEIEEGGSLNMAKLAASVYSRAMHSDTLAIFLLKTKGGFRERRPDDELIDQAKHMNAEQRRDLWTGLINRINKMESVEPKMKVIEGKK